MPISPQTLIRAPPPSPAESPENQEEEEFSAYLKRARRVPELSLPRRKPPEINLGFLISPGKGGSEAENLRLGARSIGCFQIVDYGMKEGLIRAVEDAAEGVFGMESERKKKLARLPARSTERSPARSPERSPERNWGFELEEEDYYGEKDEFFLWSCGAEYMAGVLPQENFSCKMERLLKKTKKIAEKIELILMDSCNQNSICRDSFQPRKDVNNVILCLRKHNRSKRDNFSEEKSDFELQNEILGTIIRSLGSSHALCLHFFVGASRFCVYSKQVGVSFKPAEGAVVVTVGDQLQEKSGGMYRKVIGIPEYQYSEAQKEAISIAVLYSYATKSEVSAFSCKDENGGEGEKMISVSKKLIIAAWFLVFCQMVSFFWFAKS